MNADAGLTVKYEGLVQIARSHIVGLPNFNINFDINFAMVL